MMGLVTSDEHDATLAALKKPATSDARMSNHAMTEMNMMKTLIKRSLGREVKLVKCGEMVSRVDDLELGDGCWGFGTDLQMTSKRDRRRATDKKNIARAAQPGTAEAL